MAWFTVVAFVFALGIVPTLRHTCVLVVADVWATFSPRPLAATVTDDVTTARERMLLAEVVRLRSELDRWQTRAVVVEPLVAVDAVAGHVLWTNELERDSLVALAESEHVTPEMFVVADRAVGVGTRDGVVPDGLVLAGRSVVGRVVDVGYQSASVQSSTSKDFRVTAQIVRRGHDGVVLGAEGTYVGDDEHGGQLLYVPAEQPVSVGDDVMTTGESVWSGQRLHLGVIREATLAPGEPHWTIRIESSGHLRPRTPVLVLRPRVTFESNEER